MRECPSRSLATLAGTSARSNKLALVCLNQEGVERCRFRARRGGRELVPQVERLSLDLGAFALITVGRWGLHDGPMVVRANLTSTQ